MNLEVEMKNQPVHQSKDYLSLAEVSMTGSMIMVNDSNKSRSLEKVPMKALYVDLTESGKSGKVPFDSQDDFKSEFNDERQMQTLFIPKEKNGNKQIDTANYSGDLKHATMVPKK